MLNPLDNPMDGLSLNILLNLNLNFNPSLNSIINLIAIRSGGKLEWWKGEARVFQCLLRLEAPQPAI